MKYSQYTLGLVTGFCLGCLYFMLPAFIDGFRAEPVEPPKPKSNFTVVETYKGCDVVRWSQSNFAEYKYFLHCK
jgi:hypothetical protein